jgi:hypothetical protein
MEYQSNEELYFHQWLLELQDRKIISNIEKPASLVLSEAVPIKIGNKEVNLLNEHIYTGDFEFYVDIKFIKLFENMESILTSPFSKKALKLFCKEVFGEVINNQYSPNHKCFVEVKGGFNNNNMLRIFSLNQKWIYQRYGIYYNLVKVPKIFEKTFTPEAYLKTATGKDRKINFKVKLIDEYLNE